MSKRFYITTAIDYVNGDPHLGHAYEKIATDVIARARRSLGDEVFYLTGLDEHGQKVQQAATAVGKAPQEYCDGLASVWQGFAARLGLCNNDFVRTSDPRHQAVVGAILRKLYEQGHFYRSQYRGFYSARQETFLTEKDRLADGSFDAFYGEVVELVEDNYYFRLGAHQQWLIDYLEANPEFVAPESRRNEVLGFLRSQTLEDLCISRPASRLNWGIPLPFDEEYVTYVWFDALVNYVTIPAIYQDSEVGRALQVKPADPRPQTDLWPADIHVVGKDILKFHAVYWPIMLKAMELPLPRQILAHGWWQKDGERMSKSTGNVVDPIAVIDEWGLDAFRYYVVRELDLGADGNWTDDSFERRYSAELANGLGNLVNRSLSMLWRYREGVVPKPSDELSTEVSARVGETRKLLEKNLLQAALQSIWAIIDQTNQYIDRTAPFKLAKDPAQADRLGEILYNLAETCRVLATLLWPFLPTTAERIAEQLALPSKPDQWKGTLWGGLQQGHQIGKPAPLFPRRDVRAK